MRTGGVAVLGLIAVGLGGGPARAAPPAFDGLPAPLDGAGLIGTERAGVDAAGQLGLRLDLAYLRRPLRLSIGGAITTLVSDAAVARVAIHAGAFRERIEVGASVPVSLSVLTSAGQASLSPEPAAIIGAGDLRLFLKVGLLRTSRVRLALSVAGVAPIGDWAYRSDEVWGAEARVLFDATFGWLTVVANAGARLHPTIEAGPFEIGQELTYQAALEARAHPRVHVAVEGIGSESLAPSSAAARTFAIAGSARYRPAHGIDLWLGIARSLAPGAARTDDVRIVCGLAWHPLEPAGERLETPTEAPARAAPLADSDGDGIPDVRDACPTQPEDKDGFQDDDGCPDLDNDGDGIPDAVDQCPNEPETVNGIDDQDGCPDASPRQMTPFELPPPLRFAAGQSAIPTDAATRAALEHVVFVLYSHPEVKRVRLEGHAAGEPHPHELSQARADALRAYLAAKGIDPMRLQAVGYGDTRPLGTPAESRCVELIRVDQ